MHPADLVRRSAQFSARHWWRAHEFWVRAGFEEKQLLPFQSRLRCLESVKCGEQANHVRVQTGSGLR